MTLNLKGELLNVTSPIIMGILNYTEDSFYDGGKWMDDTAFLLRVEQILSEGGKIIDLGAVSTRPNAVVVDAGTEYQRIRKAMNLIMKYFPKALVSIDTFRANIAEMALGEGAAMINDISGGEDKAMFALIGKHNIPYCLTFNTRNKTIDNSDLIPSMLSFFGEKIEQLRTLKVNDIIIDPGFGFGQTVDQNYMLMKNLAIFKELSIPILVGISRKSMIYNVLACTPQESLSGTIALNTIALLNGADILRVHDVKAAVDAVKIVQTIKQTN